MIGAKPKVLLFDEPLSDLDAKLRVEMRAELVRVHRATGALSPEMITCAWPDTAHQKILLSKGLRSRLGS
jgi:ABC-type nitrate/sulfonate/bicarbonate transport system ATPase subunit